MNKIKVKKRKIDSFEDFGKCKIPSYVSIEGNLEILIYLRKPKNLSSGLAITCQENEKGIFEKAYMKGSVKCFYELVLKSDEESDQKKGRRSYYSSLLKK